MKSKNAFDRLIEEMLVDCYGEDEQRGAFLTYMQDNVPVPFQATIVGETTQVIGFDGEATRILAYCERNGKRYKVDVLDLELPQKTTGRKWIEVYRYWCNK